MNMSPDEWDGALKSWETDNSAAIPPGYREAAQHINLLTDQVAQLSQMVQQLMGRNMGQLDATKQVADDAKSQRVSAIKERVINNLNAVQSELGLPDEEGPQFMKFAQERGYSLEDFINKDFLSMVAKDYVNARNAPEADRLRQIAERRSAISGSLGPAPGAAAATQVPAAAPSPLDEMAAMIQQRRSVGRM